jgi:hypothetical protein
MKELGRSLIVLAAFETLIGGVILVIAFSPLNVAAVGGTVALHLVMGVLLLQNHGWVNYLVAVWSIVLLALNCIGMVPSADSQRRGIYTGNVLGLLVAGALLFYAIRNLSELRKARAAGLKP